MSSSIHADTSDDETGKRRQGSGYIPVPGIPNGDYFPSRRRCFAVVSRGNKRTVKEKRKVGASGKEEKAESVDDGVGPAMGDCVRAIFPGNKGDSN